MKNNSKYNVQNLNEMTNEDWKWLEIVLKSEIKNQNEDWKLNWKSPIPFH